MILTNDSGANDGVDEVEGGHGQVTANLVLLKVILRIHKLVKVTLRRLRGFREVLKIKHTMIL